MKCNAIILWERPFKENLPICVHAGLCGTPGSICCSDPGLSPHSSFKFWNDLAFWTHKICIQLNTALNQLRYCKKLSSHLFRQKQLRKSTVNCFLRLLNFPLSQDAKIFLPFEEFFCCTFFSWWYPFKTTKRKLQIRQFIHSVRLKPLLAPRPHPLFFSFDSVSMYF